MAACLSLSASVRWPVQGDAGSQLQLLGTLMGSRGGGVGSLSAPLLALRKGYQWEAEPSRWVSAWGWAHCGASGLLESCKFSQKGSWRNPEESCFGLAFDSVVNCQHLTSPVPWAQQAAALHSLPRAQALSPLTTAYTGLVLPAAPANLHIEYYQADCDAAAGAATFQQPGLRSFLLSILGQSVHQQLLGLEEGCPTLLAAWPVPASSHTPSAMPSAMLRF